MPPFVRCCQSLTEVDTPLTLKTFMKAPVYFSIGEIVENVRLKTISPKEVVDAHVQRAQALQSSLNAFVHLDVRGAREQARAAEDAVMRGRALGALHGVPLSVKGCIDVAGWQCPAGSVLRKDYVAAQDAVLVERLKKAGAILLGNTNTPEFLMNYETDNALAGKTSNPWNEAYSAGGSSGGEAAAIASGCSGGGVGSDGGGSIRVPAHFCGICGLKPTPGRIPATGHFPPTGGAFGWIGVAGPMARTVADLRALFAVMQGPDPGDPLSARVRLREVDDAELKDLRIGILEADALGTATPEAQAAVLSTANHLAAQGFVVEPLRLRGLERALELWWFFFGPVVAHLFERTIGGHEEKLSLLFRDYLKQAEPAEPVTVDQLLAACAERDVLRGEILRQMNEVAILISPVSSKSAFRHGRGTWRSGAEESYRDTMRWSQWLNLTGFPGASVPVSISPQGLPIGIQVIGRPHEEELVLAVAEEVERARGPWQAPPI
jgi:Asp-tRNA(Asn)/Glu-tRNA(Gln) amidotransferase A subunit family amidase